jgi:hypothetical protein
VRADQGFENVAQIAQRLVFIAPCVFDSAEELLDQRADGRALIRRGRRS